MKYRNRKQPTEEQRAAAKARRESFMELAKQASAMTPDQIRDFFPNPVTTIEGRPLSPCNTYLALRQNPQATLVGGYGQWKKANRHVVKGAKSIMIWAPIESKNQSSQAAQPDPNQASDPNDPKKAVRFIPASVFDISQTQPFEKNNGNN
jgi:hypothetical protein